MRAAFQFSSLIPGGLAVHHTVEASGEHEAAKETQVRKVVSLHRPYQNIGRDDRDGWRDVDVCKRRVDRWSDPYTSRES